jgi:hypothetical protein
MSEQSTNKPAVNVFTKVFNKEGESRIGSQIGVGFKFKEKEGYNVILDAQPLPNPITGRIELVLFPSNE